jgi:hypothetical protein
MNHVVLWDTVTSKAFMQFIFIMIIYEDTSSRIVPGQFQDNEGQ